MKKRITIRIILIVLVLAVAGLYLSRDQWAGYMLKKEVSRRSGGDISLSFSALHLEVFKKRLIVVNPSLSYKNTFINRDHTLKLEASNFKKLSIYDLFLWDFFFHHQYICKEFNVVHPGFQLASGKKIKTSTNFDPATWIDIFQHHHFGIVPIRFQIQHAHVELGKIELGKTKQTGEYGGAEYSISIEDLGNIANKTAPGEISYKSLRINIHNFFRNSKLKNYSLKIDSASYLSHPQEFIVSGLHYNSAQKSKEPLSLNVNRATVKGFIPDTAGKTLGIVSVRWRGGSITFPEGKLLQLFSSKQPDKKLEKIMNTFSFLKCDTLLVNRVHISHLGNNHDTLLFIKNFNINILDAIISEKTFSDPLRFMSYGSIQTQMQGFYYMNAQKGDKIHATGISYGSGKKVVAVDHLNYEKFCPTDKKPVLEFSSKRVKVENFSDEKFRKEEMQHIVADVDNPDIRIWENRVCRPGVTGFSGTFHKLDFKSLNLEKGTLQYFGNKRESFSLSGLDLYAGNLRPRPGSGRNSFSYDTLYFKVGQSGLINPSHALKMSAGSIEWLGGELTMENLKLKQNEKSHQRNITVPSADFSGIRLDSLIAENKLIGDEADLYNPDIIIQRHDTLNAGDTIPFSTRFSQFPLKISFSQVLLLKGHLDLTEIHPKDSIKLNTGINVALDSLKFGYDKNQPASLPPFWSVSLYQSSYRSNRISWKTDSIVMNGSNNTLNIRKLYLSTHKNNRSYLDYHIKVPLIQVNKMDYPKLFRGDSLVFGKIALHRANLHLTVPEKIRDTLLLPKTTVLFDSLEMNHSGFTVERELKTSNLKITGSQLDILYKPLLISLPDSLPAKDILKKWDVSLERLQISDTVNHVRVDAKGIALQSKFDQLSVDTLTGSNLPENGAIAGIGKDYASFKMHQMKFSGLQFTGPVSKGLEIAKWTTPDVWLRVLRETGKKKQPQYPGLMSSLVSKNSKLSFIKAVHIDSTHVKKLNFKFLYENGKKQLSIQDVGIDVNDIELDSTLSGSHPNNVFRDLKMDARGKSIISGDSMYTFRTRDIRVNLPLKRISLDSITVTPRYQREAFFKKAKKQTDRVTVYGKSIDFNNFDLPDLLKNKVFHVGNVSLNDFNVLFQRDKHYPLSDSARPMPLAMLREVPYKFDADSVLIKHSFVSYYEYEKKSTHPGIFFINNFNVYFLNVTNNFATLKPGAVLRIHGSGQMMRASDLNFVLLMPYFSTDNRFWFSAQTGYTDLTRFNSLARNIAGISIVSGTGSVDVQYVSGNHKSAKGNMLFEYKNLKLRLYNRKKAKTNKGLGSPFVNFMLNNLMIRTNNPKFLKPPHKGIVYFERDPRKSFINYLWKSCFSGITSTMGFNNKQQRQEKKVEKKESKAGK